MAEPSRNMEVEKLISYTDDLVKVLVEPRDLNNLSYCHQQNLSLSSSSHSHHQDVRSSLQDCEKKVDACKQKIEEARSETVADAELDLLQRELEEELEKERFTAIGDEFNDLEQQWISVQEQKKTLQKIEKTKLRAQSTFPASSKLDWLRQVNMLCSKCLVNFQLAVIGCFNVTQPVLDKVQLLCPAVSSSQSDRMILSMYASVTNIVPDLGEQSKISGYIVDKHKDAVEKFEYDTSKMTAFDICNGVWKIISE
ncbi:uncharacterized protein HKW66_Vig0115300 [Vigna angularis]|uniref:Uncharacterized protein n=1 Tax=Phaseolus angularis TaxID=3914 RepID=A0A8T0L0H5_PHAAN|nr:uncharacterized protein HKW66_Vig0115300 [Vigna angularis]